MTESDLPSDEFVVAGLDHDVEVLTDRWGVPHIYADSRLDAFAAQGFQAARDRLFQIDLWRRRGLGRLAEVFGPAHVAQDRATRLFLYRGDMRAEWLSYRTDARDVVEAFVGGINAFVDWVMQEPSTRLPPEFGALGHEPAHWEPEDVVRIRTHGLLYNAEQELARALTVRDLGVDAERFRSVCESVAPTDPLDADLYAGLGDEVLDVYRLAFAPVDFAATTPDAASDTISGPPTEPPSGSNNWVVAPSRTATGRPLLANDPHRAVTVPSLRYLAHLEAPGLSVIGAGEPNLPGISIGHNAHVGFGLTIWPIDHEDLYVYELDPDDPDRYRYRGAWESFEVVEEHSPVADGADVVHRLVFTRHGPVVHLDRTAGRAVAVRAVWLQPGMAPYLASLEYQDAADVGQFRRALRRWGAPGANQVFADTNGDIAWQGSGLVPRRPGWDGSMPVSGDGRYEWDGFARLEELPSVHNPSAGWFSSSNENNLPAEHDATALPITADWYSTARHERITEWLSNDDQVDMATSIRMHGNADNVHGRRLLDVLAAVTPTQHGAEWSELQSWDGTEAAEARAALLFQVWVRRHWRAWSVDHCLDRLGLPAADRPRARHRLLRADTLFSDLRPDLRMAESFDLTDEDDLALVNAGVGQTLHAALAEIEDRLGPDRDAWTWGALHRTELRHAVLASAPDVPAEWGTLPAVPRAGSGDTVGLAGHDADFNAVMGSSFRMVLDVGSWDDSQVVNSPGQSGDPRSEHYADLLSLWADGDTFPLVYTRAAVDAAATRRTVLRASRSDA